MFGVIVDTIKDLVLVQQEKLMYHYYQNKIKVSINQQGK